MTEILFGERIGRQGAIRPGCAGILFDARREKVLLTRRADNGQWCLPSGGVEPGETVAEACEREVWEETGLRVRVRRLVAVCSNRDRLAVYEDGRKFQIVSLCFEVEATGGKLGLSDETTEVGFFTTAESMNMDIFPHHRDFIRDALAGIDAASVR
jgi:ADP-ribose pyrophosphatase YjhB (NUDIX family)